MSERTRRNRRRLFQAKVTGRHAITLPAALCRELELAHRQIILRKSEEEEDLERLRGILKEYFPDWAAIDEFIQEERDSWDKGMTQALKAFRAGCEPALRVASGRDSTAQSLRYVAAFFQVVRRAVKRQRKGKA